MNTMIKAPTEWSAGQMLRVSALALALTLTACGGGGGGGTATSTQALVASVSPAAQALAGQIGPLLASGAPADVAAAADLLQVNADSLSAADFSTLLNAIAVVV